MSISLLASYIGGAISLFSPCSALVIPTFVASAIRNQNLPKTLFQFTLGLSLAFIPLGLGVSLVTNLFGAYRQEITGVIGFVFLSTALVLLLGLTLPVPKFSLNVINVATSRHLATNIILGLVAGVGSTVCVGPILGAILTLAAVSSSPWLSLLHMSAYVGGIVTPLILVSILARFPRFSSISQISTARFRRPLYAKLPHLNWFTIMEIILLIFLAAVFLLYQANLNRLPFLRTSGWFDLMLDFQDSLFLN